jgi:spore coat polysaccharide biosynthesis protein SpsF
MNRRICATIEARMSSTRLPGKVLLDAAGKPMLERMIERVRRVPSLDGIVIATTSNPGDDPIVELAQRLEVGIFRGSEDDVMSRVLGAAQSHGVDVIVELTGDCPVIDPLLIERVIEAYLASGADYCSNVLTRSYPIGMDTQVFGTHILADAFSRTDDPSDREHVSLFIYRHPELYRLHNVLADPRHRKPDLRLTLDTHEDLRLLRAVFDQLLPAHPDFGLDDILDLLQRRTDLQELNAHVEHRWV